jgi:4-hydroxybenzoate polyprenyltransferase
VLPALLRATHPLPAGAVTAMAGAVVAALGASPAATALATASTLAGQLSVGWSNDFFDRAEDAAAGRVDKPIPAGEVSAAVVWRAAVVAVPVCVGLSLPLGGAATAVMAGVVASAWAYNLGLQRTALSWLPYAVSFGLAPVYLWLAAGEGLPAVWIVVGGALLGVAGHLTNVLPDIESDRLRGARGLAHRLGPGRSLSGAAVALATTLGLAVASSGGLDPAVAGAAVVAVGLIASVLLAGATGRSRLAFRLTVAAAGAVVAVFVLSAR